MSVYIGYYRFNPEYVRDLSVKAAQAGAPVLNEVMRAKVIAIREKLPPSIKLIGSYAVLRSQSNQDEVRHPNFWIVECDDPGELAFVNSWYQGFLDFEWLPATALGTTAHDTTAVLAAEDARTTGART